MDPSASGTHGSGRGQSRRGLTQPARAPSPGGAREGTATPRAKPALPRPGRPPLIRVIFQKYFPRSEQRFDNREGRGKGLTIASAGPASLTKHISNAKQHSSVPDTVGRALLCQGRNRGQKKENDAHSQALCWQSQKSLLGTSWSDSMPFTFNASDVNAPQPAWKPFALTQGRRRSPTLEASTKPDA